MKTIQQIVQQVLTAAQIQIIKNTDEEVRLGEEENNLVTLCLAEGNGGREDLLKLKKHLLKAAELGNSEAQYLLAHYYTIGEPPFPRDEVEALKWHGHAALAGNELSQHIFAARCLISEGINNQEDNAIIILQALAEQGYTPSLNFLLKAPGRLKFQRANYGIDQFPDYRERALQKLEIWIKEWNELEILKKAAAANDDAAQVKLAQHYQNGKAGVINVDKALFWYEKSAARGNAKTQYILARYLESLAGERDVLNNPSALGKTEQDNKENLCKAAGWLEQAADAGEEEAQFHMGRFYENGIGLKKDLFQASRWYYLASKNSNNNITNNKKIYALACCLSRIGDKKNLLLARSYLELGASNHYAPALMRLNQLHQQHPCLKQQRSNLVELKLQQETNKLEHELSRGLSHKVSNASNASSRSPNLSANDNQFYGALLKARQAGFDVDYESVPMTSDRVRLSISTNDANNVNNPYNNGNGNKHDRDFPDNINRNNSVNNKNRYRFCAEHWNFQQKYVFRFSKEISAQKGIQVNPFTFNFPGETRTLFSFDPNGFLSIKSQDSSKIEFAVGKGIEFSEFRFEDLLQITSKDKNPLSLARVHSAKHVTIEAETLWYNPDTFKVHGKLQLLLKKPQDILTPIANPGTLSITFADSSVEASTLKNKLDADINQILSVDWKKSVEAAASKKATADLKTAKDTKVLIDTKTAADRKTLVESIKPIQILANLSAGSKDSKEVADFTLITGGSPLNIGSEAGSYIQISSTGKTSISSQSFDLVKGKIIGQQNATVISQNDVKVGSLNQAKTPSGILSSAETLLSAGKKILIEASEIYGKSGLRFRAPVMVDNVAGRVISDEDVYFDTPLHQHRLLTKYESLSGSVNYPCANIHESTKRYTSQHIAISLPAYMRAGKRFITSAETEILGSQIHFGSFQGKTPKKCETFTAFVRWTHEMLCGHKYRCRSSWYFADKIDMGTSYPATFSSATALVLSGNSIDLTGIIFAPNLALANFNLANIGTMRFDIPLPPSRRFNPILQLPIVNSPRFEYVGPKSDTVFRSVFANSENNTVSLARPSLVILNSDGSLSYCPSKKSSMLPTEMEEEVLVETLLKECGRGILDKNSIEPKAMLHKMLNNAIKVLSTGKAKAGLNAEGHPKWCAALKVPLMVYKEISFDGQFKLWPHVILPITFSKLNLRDWAGGLFSLGDINIKGMDVKTSKLIITAHIDAKGIVRVSHLSSVVLQKAVYKQTHTVTEIESNSSCFGLISRDNVTQNQVTTVSPQPGNSISGERIEFNNIGTLAFEGTSLKAGQGGFSIEASVESVKEQPAIGVSIQTHQVAAKNFLSSASATQVIPQYQINSTTLSSKGLVTINAADQDYHSLKAQAKGDINLKAKNLSLGATTIPQQVPTKMQGEDFRISVAKGNKDIGETVTLVSKTGAVNCHSGSTLSGIGTKISGASVSLSAEKGIQLIQHVLGENYQLSNKGLNGLSYVERNQTEQHKSGIPVTIVATNNIEIQSKKENIILVAPILFAGKDLKFSTPNGSTTIVPAVFRHDVSISEVSVGLSFFGSSAVEGLIRRDFRQAALGMLREFPFLASMEALMKPGSDTADKVTNGMKTLYHGYKIYKDFATSRDLKEFAAKQLHANLKVRVGVNHSEHSWTEVALPWLQARNIIIKSKNFHSKGAQVACENLSITVEQNMTIEAAEQVARTSANGVGVSVGLNCLTLTPSLGLDFHHAEQKSIEYITSHFNVAGTTSLVAGGKISLAGVYVDTLKAVLAAEDLELKTLQDESHASNVSGHISTEGSIGFSAGRQDSKYAKQQTGILAKETLFVNIEKEIKLIGAKLEAGKEAKALQVQLPDGKPSFFYELELPEKDGLLSILQLNFSKIVKSLSDKQFAETLEISQKHFVLAIINNTLPAVLQSEQTRAWKKLLRDNAQHWQIVAKEISEKIKNETLAQFLMHKIDSADLNQRPNILYVAAELSGFCLQLWLQNEKEPAKSEKNASKAEKPAIGNNIFAKVPVKKSVLVESPCLDTEGDGNCAIHAIFGKWNNNTQRIFCPDAQAKRIKVADAIRNLERHHNIFPLVLAMIQEMIMNGTPMFRALQEEKQSFTELQEHQSKEAWKKLEGALQNNKEISEFIEKETKENVELRDFKARFQKCLYLNGGILYSLIASVDSINKLFAEYNKITNAEFDMASYVLQNKSTLTEYADYIQRPGRYLLPNELTIIAFVFNVHIKYIAYNRFEEEYSKPEHHNPDGATTVGVCFTCLDGVAGHFERVKEGHFLLDVVEEVVPRIDAANNKPASVNVANKHSPSLQNGNGELRLIKILNPNSKSEKLNLKFSLSSKRWTLLHDQPGLVMATVIHGSEVVDRATGTQVGMNLSCNMIDASSSFEPVIGTADADFRSQEKERINRATISNKITLKGKTTGINQDLSKTQATTINNQIHVGGFTPIVNPTANIKDINIKDILGGPASKGQIPDNIKKPATNPTSKGAKASSIVAASNLNKAKTPHVQNSNTKNSYRSTESIDASKGKKRNCTK